MLAQAVNVLVLGPAPRSYCGGSSIRVQDQGGGVWSTALRQLPVQVAAARLHDIGCHGGAWPIRAAERQQPYGVRSTHRTAQDA